MDPYTFVGPFIFMDLFTFVGPFTSVGPFILWPFYLCGPFICVGPFTFVGPLFYGPLYLHRPPRFCVTLYTYMGLSRQYGTVFSSVGSPMGSSAAVCAGCDYKSTDNVGLHCVSKKFPPLNSLQLRQILTNFQNLCIARNMLQNCTTLPTTP